MTNGFEPQFIGRKEPVRPRRPLNESEAERVARQFKRLLLLAAEGKRYNTAWRSKMSLTIEGLCDVFHPLLPKGRKENSHARSFDHQQDQ